MKEKDNYKESIQIKNWLYSFVAILSLLLLGSTYATQYLAETFGYHQGLGDPVLGHFYNPWAWIPWSLKFSQYYPDFFKIFYIKVGASAALVFFFFIFIRLIVFRKTKPVEGLYGTAHWATDDEIKEMEILGKNEGVFIGGLKNLKGKLQYLRHNGPEHILAFAPTRSGKGLGLVLPTLLTWRHSVFVLDIKEENWSLTAGWRKYFAKNIVLKFDPTCDDGTAARFNPLAEIRVGTSYETADIQNTAVMMIDTDGTGLKDHWRQSAASFLTGVITHSLYKSKNEGLLPPNPSFIYSTINNPEITLRALLEEMKRYHHIIGEDGTEKTHPIVSQIAAEMLNKADPELSGVVSTAATSLSLYVDPLISKNTEVSDFKIMDLMNNDSPVSLYFVLSPDNIERVKPLTRLFVTQILTILIRKLKFKDGDRVQNYQHRLLLMLDEFPALGKLDIVEQSLAYMAGYGIKSYFIAQDIEQLQKAYTKNETITSGSHIRIAYATNNTATAKTLSDMTGQTTVIKSQRTVSGKRVSVLLGQVTETFQEVQRPLLTADECMTLPGAKKDASGNKIVSGGEMLIFTAGKSPIKGHQVLYFQDPVLLDRSKVAAPDTSDRLTHASTTQVSSVSDVAKEAIERIKNVGEEINTE